MKPKNPKAEKIIAAIEKWNKRLPQIRFKLAKDLIVNKEIKKYGYDK